MAEIKWESGYQCRKRNGEMADITNDCPEYIWSFKRTNDGNEVACVFNFSGERINVNFNENFPGEGFTSFPNSSEVHPANVLELAPWEYRIYTK